MFLLMVHSPDFFLQKVPHFVVVEAGIVEYLLVVVAGWSLAGGMRSLLSCNTGICHYEFIEYF